MTSKFLIDEIKENQGKKRGEDPIAVKFVQENRLNPSRVTHTESLNNEHNINQNKAEEIQAKTLIQTQQIYKSDVKTKTETQGYIYTEQDNKGKTRDRWR